MDPVLLSLVAGLVGLAIGVGAAVVIGHLAVDRDSRLSTLLRWGPLPTLGLWSYGIYLFYCDESWNCLNDTHHADVAAAEVQAEFEFDGVTTIRTRNTYASRLLRDRAAAGVARQRRPGGGSGSPGGADCGTRRPAGGAQCARTRDGAREGRDRRRSPTWPERLREIPPRDPGLSLGNLIAEALGAAQVARIRDVDDDHARNALEIKKGHAGGEERHGPVEQGPPGHPWRGRRSRFPEDGRVGGAGLRDMRLVDLDPERAHLGVEAIVAGAVHLSEAAAADPGGDGDGLLLLAVVQRHHVLALLAGFRSGIDAGERVDARRVGAVPVLSATVWVGRPDSDKAVPGLTGGTVSAPIWRSFMVEALRGTPPVDFPTVSTKRPAVSPIKLPEARPCNPSTCPTNGSRAS